MKDHKMANVRDFQYISEIARYGSISKAAEALYITQPTLTKFLQRVEQETGAPLFHRVGKKFIPTPAGEVYVEKARSILLLNSQLDQELDDLAMMRRGSIRLGTTAGRADYVVSSVLPRFARRYPGVRVLLSMSHTEQLLRMIFNNELDMVLANYDGEQPSLAHEYIGEEELVLVVPRDSPLVRGARREEGFRFPVTAPEQWRDEPFVLPSAVSRSYLLAQEYFRSVGVQPRIAAEISGVQFVTAAVHAGVGISIFTSVPIPDFRGITYLSLGRKDIPRQRVAVITRRGICPDEAHEAFIQLLREAHSG